jgi:hypothetical protein
MVEALNQYDMRVIEATKAGKNRSDEAQRCLKWTTMALTDISKSVAERLDILLKSPTTSPAKPQLMSVIW